MRNRTAATLVLGLGGAWLFSLGGCGDEEALCGGAASGALATATPGAVVTLGDCAVEGPLRVPAGVTVRGTTGSVITAPAGGAAVVLAGGPSASVLEDVTVRSSGVVAVYAQGDGSATVRGVRVLAEQGVALAATEGVSLQVVSSELRGPVTPANADDPRFLRVVGAAPPPGECQGCDCQPGETREDGLVCDPEGRWAAVTATYGLYLLGVTAELDGLDVGGFASAGAVFVDSDVTWRGGRVAENLGLGLRQSGGTARLEDVEVANTWSGLRGTAPYAVASTDGAELSSVRMALLDNDRYGLLSLGGTGDHEDLVAERNGDAAVWVGASASFSLRGAGTALCDNRFAGFVAVDSTGMRLDDVTVERTQASVRSVGALGRVEIGDGLHLVGSTSAVDVQRVELTENARAGVVVDFGMTDGAGLRFTDVTVAGTGSQLGAVAGVAMSGTLTPLASAVAPAWDQGITREGSTVANDAAQTSPLDALTIDSPGGLPSRMDAVGVILPML